MVNLISTGLINYERNKRLNLFLYQEALFLDF